MERNELCINKENMEIEKYLLLTAMFANVKDH